MKHARVYLKTVLFLMMLLPASLSFAEQWTLKPQIAFMHEAARLVNKEGLDINYRSDGDDWTADIELSANSPLLYSSPGLLRHTLMMAKADYNGLAYTLYETSINAYAYRYEFTERADIDFYIGAGAGLLKADGWFEKQDYKTGSVKIGVEGRGIRFILGVEWNRRWSEVKPFNNRNQKLDTGGVVFKVGMRF